MRKQGFVLGLERRFGIHAHILGRRKPSVKVIPLQDLSIKEQELVAIGAAIASNCVPCIEYHIPHAREAGLSDAQISEAVRMADRVRRVPATKVLQTAAALIGESVLPDGSTWSGEGISSGQGQCCGQQPDTVKVDAED